VTLNTVRIHNHGPGDVLVLDGNANITRLSVESGNVFATPIEILDVTGGQAYAEPPPPPRALPPQGDLFPLPPPPAISPSIERTT